MNATVAWLVLVESNTTGSGRLFCAAARRFGLRPVLLARDPDRYPYVRLDAVDARVVDTGSIDAVLAACAGLDGPIAGVTSSSEYFVATAADAARALGLPHPDPDAVRTCRDKARQRARLRERGLPGPAFAAATDPAAAVAAATRIGLPVVVKPVTGSGSVATRLCRTPAEVRAAAALVLDTDPSALGLPPQRAVLVEEYLTGPEFSVETLGGIPIAVVGKHLGVPPHFVETGHDLPAPVPAAVAEELAAAALDALRALGLGGGPAHVELRLTTGGPRVIEVNPRLAGGMIPALLHAVLGVDPVAAAVAGAAGLPAPARTPPVGAAAAIRFLLAPHGGRLSDVDGVVVARAMPGVVEVGLVRRPGEELVLANSFRDRLGYVIAVAGDLDTAARQADAAVAALRPRIVPIPLPVGGDRA